MKTVAAAKEMANPANATVAIATVAIETAAIATVAIATATLFVGKVTEMKIDADTRTKAEMTEIVITAACQDEEVTTVVTDIAMIIIDGTETIGIGGVTIAVEVTIVAVETPTDRIGMAIAIILQQRTNCSIWSKAKTRMMVTQRF